MEIGRIKAAELGLGSYRWSSLSTRVSRATEPSPGLCVPSRVISLLLAHGLSKQHAPHGNASRAVVEQDEERLRFGIARAFSRENGENWKYRGWRVYKVRSSFLSSSPLF